MNEHEYQIYLQKCKDRYPRFKVPSKYRDQIHTTYKEETDVKPAYPPTVQSVFQAGWMDYCTKHDLSNDQWKALMSITRCKTSHNRLIGLSDCNVCGYEQPTYASCGNRNCTCNAAARAEWLEKCKADDYDAPHFHLVFTVPEELNALFFINQKKMYSLLMRCSSETVLELSQDTKYLGVKPGIIMVLHTWSQLLLFHPHVHMAIIAGGVNKQNQYISGTSDFFIPIHVLRDKFRGKFLAEIQKLIVRNELKLPAKWEVDHNPDFWKDLRNDLYEKEWTPYIKSSADNPDLIEYLARYMNKVAIGNTRILEVTSETVAIQYRDSRDHNRQKVAVMGIQTFIGRFLLHVLPSGFQKTRRYGVYSGKNKKKLLKIIRNALHKAKAVPKYEGKNHLTIAMERWGLDLLTCPRCKRGRMINKMSSTSMCCNEALLC